MSLVWTARQEAGNRLLRASNLEKLAKTKPWHPAVNKAAGWLVDTLVNMIHRDMNVVHIYANTKSGKNQLLITLGVVGFFNGRISKRVHLPNMQRVQSTIDDLTCAINHCTWELQLRKADDLIQIAHIETDIWHSDPPRASWDLTFFTPQDHRCDDAACRQVREIFQVTPGALKSRCRRK